ncbi:carboxypeptidase-like regulatory domain-containing protein [Pontibacter lucknowensis]|uniref:CarboxypepD_reg-like domain-containing protein n=1 Tax=Pontibacter lucknowensis TaxID=1077936 RepID=A0A1N6XCR6_9BACT|nr:carboxypeptidase-like regulatory domain-containing protein [Pontibacter lucknowensis]SIR00136.1 CarboxypepD_reg-like domain-containing protein [Pontibacter lucknowensis]
MRNDKIQISEWGLEEHPSVELLRQYEEGTLPPATNYELEKHLLDCEMCEDILTGMSLSDRERTRQSRYRIWQRVRTRLRRKHRPRALHGLADWRVALGLLMMFCSLGLILFYHYTRTAAQEKAAMQAAEILPPSPEELLARTIDAALVLDIPAPPASNHLESSRPQAEFSLQGQVLDTRGQGIGLATVQVQGSPWQTSCDEQGFFRLPLDAGSYTLLVSSAGYATQTFSVKSPDKAVRLLLEKKK